MFTLPRTSKQTKKFLNEFKNYEDCKARAVKTFNLKPTQRKWTMYRHSVVFKEWRDSEGRLYFYDIVDANYKNYYDNWNRTNQRKELR